MDLKALADEIRKDPYVHGVSPRRLAGLSDRDVARAIVGTCLSCGGCLVSDVIIDRALVDSVSARDFRRRVADLGARLHAKPFHDCPHLRCTPRTCTHYRSNLLR